MQETHVVSLCSGKQSQRKYSNMQYFLFYESCFLLVLERWLRNGLPSQGGATRHNEHHYALPRNLTAEKRQRTNACNNFLEQRGGQKLVIVPHARESRHWLTGHWVGHLCTNLLHLVIGLMGYINPLSRGQKHRPEMHHSF